VQCTQCRNCCTICPDAAIEIVVERTGNPRERVSKSG